MAGPDWMLIDGSSLIFRAFFGVPRTMRAPDGSLNNAIRGLLDVMARALVPRRPRRMVVASDEDWRPNWRVELLPGYKAHRVAEPVPPELAPQIPRVWEVLDAIGIPVVGVRDYEAEDIIATLVRKAKGTVEIVSGDRDLFALVRDPSVWVLYPEGKGQWRKVDEADIEARYSIPGRAYGDYAVLRGDPSDGLPGLRGVGDKNAAALLRKHGSVEGLLRDGKLRDEERDYLQRALKVVTPVDNIPIELPEARVPPAPHDAARLDALKQKYGLGGSVERLLDILHRPVLPAE